MRYNIKARCAALGITINTLRQEVEVRTRSSINISRFSNIINGNICTKSAEEILEIADKILTEWESERK